MTLSELLSKAEYYSLITDEEYKELKKQIQPCEDCISREQAVYVASGYCAPQNIADELRKLPPVTPQPKTGHWIDVFGGCECSECSCLEAGHSDYCPNCGAKMEVEG